MISSELLTPLSVGAIALYTLVTAASRAIDRLLALAEYYDVAEVLVGMTVLAVGTSLPELSSHLVASLGILSGVLDYRVASAVVYWDFPFKLAAGVGLLVWTLYWRDGELTRTEGAYLLGLYFLFVAGRLLLFPGQ